MSEKPSSNGRFQFHIGLKEALMVGTVIVTIVGGWTMLNAQAQQNTATDKAQWESLREMDRSDETQNIKINTLENNIAHLNKQADSIQNEQAHQRQLLQRIYEEMPRKVR